MSQHRPRAYLAGPDVFFPNPVEIGAAKKAICAEHGLEGVFPLDANLDLAGLSLEEQGYRCFDFSFQCLARLERAQNPGGANGQTLR